MTMTTMQKAGLGGMAILMGLGVGVSAMPVVGQPTQEVHANGGVGAVYGETLKMKTARAVYYDANGSPGKKEAGYYKGTTYTVQKTYKNGYYKVKIHGVSGYRWMSYQSVLGDW